MTVRLMRDVEAQSTPPPRLLLLWLWLVFVRPLSVRRARTPSLTVRLGGDTHGMGKTDDTPEVLAWARYLTTTKEAYGYQYEEDIEPFAWRRLQVDLLRARKVRAKKAVGP